jgi:hypothetical protein
MYLLPKVYNRRSWQSYPHSDLPDYVEYLPVMWSSTVFNFHLAVWPVGIWIVTNVRKNVLRPVKPPRIVGVCGHWRCGSVWALALWRKVVSSSVQKRTSQNRRVLMNFSFISWKWRKTVPLYSNRIQHYTLPKPEDNSRIAFIVGK